MGDELMNADVVGRGNGDDLQEKKPT